METVNQRREAAYERLIEILEAPNFIGKYVKPNKATMIFVPHGKYVSRANKIVKSMFDFDDVRITVSTVSDGALREAQYHFILVPPTSTLVPREAGQLTKIREHWAIINRFFDNYTEY